MGLRDFSESGSSFKPNNVPGTLIKIEFNTLQGEKGNYVSASVYFDWDQGNGEGKDENGNIKPEFYSCGTTMLYQGTEILPDPNFPKKISLNKHSMFAMFLEALSDAGFDTNILDKTNDVSVLFGTKGILVQKPLVDSQGNTIKTKGKKNPEKMYTKERTVFQKITSMPGKAKASTVTNMPATSSGDELVQLLSLPQISERMATTPLMKLQELFPLLAQSGHPQLITWCSTHKDVLVENKVISG